MKNIRTAILAVCMGALGSLALRAQQSGPPYSSPTHACCDLGPQGGPPPQPTNNFSDGYAAFDDNKTGGADTAIGGWALTDNTTGGDNSGFGYQTLKLNRDGNKNTAVGSQALANTNGGNDNSAFGYQSLWKNTSGSYNTAAGVGALAANKSGGYNTALGVEALDTNETGKDNIAIGYMAGISLPSDGSYNIDIGNQGAASDNDTIRIGTSGTGTSGTQTAFYVAGAYTGIDGAPVYVDSNGQLGTSNSSIRFKEDVHDMAAASDGLMRLRPVTFRYKKPNADGSKPIDYGLIAEEVAAVYPDLVVRDADGQIQAVQYQKLTPMLLNEVQKERRLLEQHEKTIEQQEKSAARREESLLSLKQQLAALPLLEKRLAALEAAQPSGTVLETRLETK
jgi:hypothetical protein